MEKTSNKNRLSLTKWQTLVGIIVGLTVILTFVLEVPQKIGNWKTGKSQKFVPLKTDHLLKIEKEIYPELKHINNHTKFKELEGYYRSCNIQFINYLKRLSDSISDPNYKSVTAISAASGYGKTSLVIGMIQKEYATYSVCTIKLKKEINSKKFIEKSDFSMVTKYNKNTIIVNTLPYYHFTVDSIIKIALANNKSGCRIVILDELDEIHPESAKELMESLYSFVDTTSMNHIFFLVGRPESFYWYTNHPKINPINNFIILEPLNIPIYEDIVDFKYRLHNYLNYIKPPQLRDSTEFMNRIKELIHDYPFLRFNTGTFSSSKFLIEYSKNYNKKNIKNELNVMRDFYGEALERNALTHGRPSTKEGSAYQKEYLFALEKVAINYLNKIEEDGWFGVNNIENIEVKVDSTVYMFNVRELLDRSGLITIKPINNSFNKYRFEPFWIHRYLVNSYNNRKINI